MDKHLDVSNLNEKALSVFSKETALLDSLAEWLRLADRNLSTAITKLADLNAPFQSTKPLVVFRGFNIDAWQESFGITLGNTPGQLIKVKSQTSFVSFSKDPNISRAFGKTLVSTVLTPKKTRFLEITPELYYLVAMRVNHGKFRTQDEVILIPPYAIDVKIIELKKPSWYLW